MDTVAAPVRTGRWSALTLTVDCLVVGAMIAGGAGVASADTDLARYNSIIERNPFGLKPPPPPPDPAASQPPPPPVQLATVKLTGILSVLSSRRACLEIIPGPGKQLLKPVLSEGEKVESVEVVSIDIDKNQVVIKNGPVTTNLTFEVVKSSAPTPPPGGQVPGIVPPVLPPGGGAVVPPPQAAAFNYSQPNRGRSGSIMAGGAPSYEPAATSNPGVNPAASSAAAASAGFRSIPSRTMRGGFPQVQEQNAGMTPEAAVIDMEQKRTINPALPYPPTVLSPISGRPLAAPPRPGQ